jgi:hypothetical protein
MQSLEALVSGQGERISGLETGRGVAVLQGSQIFRFEDAATLSLPVPPACICRFSRPRFDKSTFQTLGGASPKRATEGADSLQTTAAGRSTTTTLESTPSTTGEVPRAARTALQTPFFFRCVNAHQKGIKTVV